MTIEFECSECLKDYRVKDEYAGRRLRCKECGTSLRVPASNVYEESWESTDLGDYEDEEDIPSRRPPRKKKSKSKKRRRSRSSDSMPATVIISEIILVIVTLISVLDLIGFLMVQDYPKLTGVGIRIMILISIFVGLINQSNNARRSGIALCILGLLIQAIVLAAGMGGRMHLAPAMFAMVVFILCLTITLLGCMLSPSARDYCQQ